MMDDSGISDLLARLEVARHRSDDYPQLAAQPAHRAARLLMEAVAVLHQRGAGQLKLCCYVKEGLGAWRHWVFASDMFPVNIRDWPGPSVHGSFPGLSSVQGSSAEEIADWLMAQRPEVIEAGHGQDETYVTWYRSLLATYPDGVLEMETPFHAAIVGRGAVAVPVLRAWHRPPLTAEEQAAAEAQAQAWYQATLAYYRERHRRRHGGGQSET